MSQHLERCIRAYIAQGAGLAGTHVRKGNFKGPRPKDPYATLLLRTDQRRSYPEHRGMHNTAGILTGTLQVQPRRATYSLQFYREGAVDLAEKFDRFVQSPVGLLQAQTSFASGGGSLRHIRVIQGGSGYDPMAPPNVALNGLYGAGSGAMATASVASGAVSGIALDAPGKDYIDLLQAVGGASGVILDPPPSGETATATAIGWGHTVVVPLQIRRLDVILGDSFEERSQLDLMIDYTAWDTESIMATGTINTWDWELFSNC